MSLLGKMAIPYRTGLKPRRLFELLLNGPITTGEIVDLKICVLHRRVKEIVSLINMLDGVRVMCVGDPDKPGATWTMTSTNPAGFLMVGAGKVHTGAVPEEKPLEVGTLPKAPPKIGLYIVPPDFPFVRQSAEEGDNVFLVGPSGSGKTEMAAQVAREMKADFIRQNFNGETTIDNLIGYSEITNDGGVSVTSWHDGELARAVRLASEGKKVVYLADEVTAGKPEVLFQFHRVLEVKRDGSREMEVNGELLRTKPGCLAIIGASNSFRADETGMFQGVNPMNMAFANRWTGGVFLVDYAPNEDEILTAHGVDERVAKALHQYAKAIRQKSFQEGLNVVCSTRQLIAVGKKAGKWGCKRALLYVYLNSLTADEVERVAGPVGKTQLWPK